MIGIGRAAIGLALLALFAASPARAAEYYVDVTNATDYTMFHLYVSPAASDSWEEDVLGDDVLAPGETSRVTLSGYKRPVFDVRLVDEDGDTYTFFDIDVSRQDLRVTLDDLDPEPAASGTHQYYVDVTNSTGYTILYLYVSPEASDSWEEDVLGDDVLSPGETTRVTLNGYASPIFDVRLVDEDGDSYTFFDVNVARRDLNVTLDDLDD